MQTTSTYPGTLICARIGPIGPIKGSQEPATATHNRSWGKSAHREKVSLRRSTPRSSSE